MIKKDEKGRLFRLGDLAGPGRRRVPSLVLAKGSTETNTSRSITSPL